jgi:hypothetical protein
MTKQLDQKLVNQDAAVLDYAFWQGRSNATAKLHNMQAKTPINKERPTRRAESPSPIASAQGERPEARQWTCISKLHWRSVSKGARAYRALSAAGVAWSEVVYRTTRDTSSHEVLDDIHPVRDHIGEAAACTRFGGSRDIQTDI